MRILIGVDGSPEADVACQFVASRTWPEGTRVTLLGALEPAVDWAGPGVPGGNWLTMDTAALSLVLEGRADTLRRAILEIAAALPGRKSGAPLTK